MTIIDLANVETSDGSVSDSRLDDFGRVLVATPGHRAASIADDSVVMPDLVELRLSDVRIGWRPRAADDPGHVELLTECGSELPPVLVRRESLEIVDGWHRVLAAQRAERRTIFAVMFDGDADDAAIEAVRANVCHGKPLDFEERRRAAAHLVKLRPSWSDRRLAAVCAVSPSTVASLRRDGDRGATRLGRDGKKRPVDATAARARIAELLSEYPNAKVRWLAEQAGASQGTVIDVRRRLERGESPIPEKTKRQREPRTPVADRVSARLVTGVQGDTQLVDRAYFGSREATRFAEAFNELAVSNEHAASLDPVAVPLSRIYEVAAVARSRAAYWTGLADRLEGRAHR